MWRAAAALIDELPPLVAGALGHESGDELLRETVRDGKVDYVAISRDGEPVDGPLDNVTIEAGDNAVLEVNDDFFYACQIDHDFALTKALDGFQLQRTDRAVESILITLTMIGVVAMGWMSMLNAGLLASGAMLVTGCLTFRTAARSIDWGTLVVIACAIGLESAVTRSGLAEQIAGLLTAMGGDNPHLALAVIFVGCSFMTNVITNNAAAAFMFPIAYATAQQLGVCVVDMHPAGTSAEEDAGGVHLADARARDVSVGHRELKTCPHLFRGSARTREPSPGRPRIIPIGLRKIENDAIHGPMNLIKEPPIPLPQNRHQIPQPPGRLNRFVLNNESHECLLFGCERGSPTWTPLTAKKESTMTQSNSNAEHWR